MPTLEEEFVAESPRQTKSLEAEFIPEKTPIPALKPPVSRPKDISVQMQETLESASRNLASLTPEERDWLQKPLLSLPDLVPWQLKAASAAGVPGAATVEKVARGTIAPVKGMVEAMTSPLGIATAPVLVGAPELAGLAMAGQALKEGVPEAARKIGEASVTGDVEQMAQGLTELGLNSAMVVGGPFALKAGAGAFGKEPTLPEPKVPPVIERLAPETAKVLEEEFRPVELSPEKPAAEGGAETTPTPTVEPSKGGKIEPAAEPPVIPSEGPGAASPSDFPTAPGVFSRTTESAMTTLRKGRDALKNVWVNRDVRETMVVDKDSLDNQARRAGRVAANDIRGDIRRTFKKEQSVAEDALSFVVESQGDYDALDAMREKLIASDKADPTWRKRAVDAIDYAKYHWEELRDSASQYEDATQAQLSEENRAGIDTLKRRGYVMHAQDVDESVLGGGGEPTGFKKVRTHDTFADSIANGVDPQTLNAVDLLQSRVSAGQRMINNKAWVEGLRNLQAHDGTPIATDLETVRRSDGSTYQQAPQGYHMEGVGRTPIAVRDGFEGLFHALTDPSAWSRTAVGRAAMETATTSKSAVLAFDTFHLGRIAFWDSLIKTLGVKTFKAPFPSYKKGVSLLDTSEAEFTKMANAGEIPKEWLPELTESKRRIDMALKTGFNVGRVSDALYSDWLHAMPVIGTFNKFLFDQFQRGAMAESWLLEFDRLKRARPEMDDMVAARQVSKDLNTRFGNLGRQGIFKSRTAQDTARTLALAPQWNEGLIRSELGAIKQTGEMFMDAAHGERIYAGVLLRSVGGMVAAQFAANQLINYITRGKPTWENPEEGMGAKLSAWIPDVVGKGPGFFLHPMGLAAETTHLLLNAYARTGDFQKTLMNYARSRASVAMRPVLTFITNSDFLGRTMKPGTVWGEMVKESIPTPIGAGAIGSAVKQIATGKESETFPGQIQKQVMASFGVKTEQAPNPNARMTALATQFLKDKKIDRPKWQGAPGDYAEVTSQLKVGNETKARELMADLLDKKKASDIADHFRDYPHTTFTGKRSLEGAFFKSLNPEQQATYKQANKDRVDISKRAIAILREELAKKRKSENLK